MSQSDSLLRTKPLDRILAQAAQKEGGLKRVLGAWDLTAIGVGAIIGAGIFVLTGTAAKDAAGPSIMLSYIFAGFACILAAFCYTEFATKMPISGSAYTYAYATVGEVFAWIIGWDLILEYTIGASTVAVGWTHYLEQFLQACGVTIPKWIIDIPVLAKTGPLEAGADPYHVHINFAAVVLIVGLTALLCKGVKESAFFNAIMVAIKLMVVLLVIFAGAGYVNPGNWQPFMPFGWSGVIQGGALVFFAYIGFDAVSTAAEEVKNPNRDLPIGIIASLVICTILYIAVSAVITGMVPYTKIDSGAPLAAAFGEVGLNWARFFISLGGFVGLTTVVLVLLLSQPRIWFAMSRDGLLWPWFSRIHPRTHTPVNATVLAGVIAGVMALGVPMATLHHTVSIGTLFAFVVVSGSILILRYKDESNPAPVVTNTLVLSVGLAVLCKGLAEYMAAGKSLHSDTYKMALTGIGGLVTLACTIYFLSRSQRNLPTTFACPGVPIVPILGMAANIFLMVQLSSEAWIRLFVWLFIGFVIYFFYGRSHSRLSPSYQGDPDAPDEYNIPDASH